MFNFVTVISASLKMDIKRADKKHIGVFSETKNVITRSASDVVISL